MIPNHPVKPNYILSNHVPESKLLQKTLQMQTGLTATASLACLYTLPRLQTNIASTLNVINYH